MANFKLLTKDDEKCIQLFDQHVIGHMRNLTELSALYESDQPVVRLNEIAFLIAMEIRRLPRELRPLQDLLKKEFKDAASIVERMTKDGVISFNYLWCMFAIGAKIAITDGDELIGAEVTSCKYISSFFGKFFEISYKTFIKGGSHISVATDTCRVSGFSETSRMDELPCRIATDEDLAMLTARGQWLHDKCQTVAYLTYDTHARYKEWYQIRHYRAQGRCMIDPHSFFRINPNYARSRYDEENVLISVNPEDIYMMPAWIGGFSFACKKWAEFAVSHLAEIEFMEDSFDQLVLDQENKDLIQALVTHSDSSFQDIISGKGGGCIFLLHGPPGTGKTLTAEAISEYLRRPLYSVSVGELGVTPVELEENLRVILDMAVVWNAVILIDEADIFLEERTTGDILRNAMVGIFLRLLEYHQGVLFLTSNRVSVFDEAFHSRISVALQYPVLNKEARFNIWTNLLAAAKIEGLDPSALSDFDLNGRQIKTNIRLAQTLAKNEDVPVTMAHIRRTTAITRQFQRDIAAINSQKGAQESSG